jgi:hypothetical protein
MLLGANVNGSQEKATRIIDVLLVAEALMLFGSGE